MGYALAAAAARKGHQVLLISGPTSLEVPAGVDLLPVESAREMFEAVENHINTADAAIFAAAVADYRPVEVPRQKIKKSGETLTLELVRTPDILGSARSRFDFRGTLVGFAAETEHLEANARDKLVRKSCDLIVANDVSRRDIGFESSQNEVLLVFPDRSESLPKDEKEHLAYHILDAVIALHHGLRR